MKKTIFAVLATSVYLFSGTPSFTDGGMLKDNSGTKIELSYPNPCIIDWDNDGDQDLLVGVYDTESMLYYENIGTAREPILAESTVMKAGGATITLSGG